jgi:hypothetical protein
MRHPRHEAGAGPEVSVGGRGATVVGVIDRPRGGHLPLSSWPRLWGEGPPQLSSLAELRYEAAVRGLESSSFGAK